MDPAIDTAVMDPLTVLLLPCPCVFQMPSAFHHRFLLDGRHRHLQLATDHPSSRTYSTVYAMLHNNYHSVALFLTDPLLLIGP